MVKLPDKISNIRDIIEEPPSDWDLERRQEYVEWGKKVVGASRRQFGSGNRFDEIVGRFEKNQGPD